MADPTLAVFKYQHDDPLVTPLGGALRFLAFVVLVALAFYVNVGLGPFALVGGMAVLFITWPKRRLVLGPRYLLCGNKVVYYANVRKMVLRPGQVLILHTDAGTKFDLDWERFPTGARKEAKIKANKARKFEKVSQGIIRRVLGAAPGVECEGIKR